MTIFPTLIAAQPCLTGADSDCNNEVNITELLDYIDDWYSCSECVPDLFQAIEAYYGIGQCVPDSVATTCGTWVCGTRDNNCGQVVSCPPGCGPTESCSSGVCIPAPQCGNGDIELGENCDDGNTADGDGCGSGCSVEPGWVCAGEPSVCDVMSTDTNVWVDVDGTGTDCSESNPCSLQTAIDNAAAGDVIGLTSGYYGEISSTGVSIDGRQNSGFITIQALPGQNAEFRSIRLHNAGYWKFSGLTVSPELDPGAYSPGRLFGISGDSDNIILENSELYYIDDSSGWSASDWTGYLSGTGTNGAMHAIRMYDSVGPNVIIRNNTVRNVRFGIEIGNDGALIEHNVIENIAADGLHGDGIDNVVVQYNTIKNFYDVDGNHDDAIQFWTTSGDQMNNIVIRGNLILMREIGETNPLLRPLTDGQQSLSFTSRNPAAGGCPDDSCYRHFIIENNVVITSHLNALLLNSGRDSVIRNNIVFDPTGTGSDASISVWYDGTNNTIVNNIAPRYVLGVNLVVPEAQAGNVDVDDYDWDQLFVDWRNYDLRHAAGSPLLDIGNAQHAPAIDFLGVTRPQGPGIDIGPYELMQAMPCTAPADPSSECDDGNSCTNDVCGSDLLCDNEPMTGTSCDDGLWCNGADTCQSGICQHAGNPCPADAYACTTETCTESTQSCSTTYDHNACDDSNVCTDDECTATGCIHPYNTAPCDDGIACTENDACSGGTCQPGTPNDAVCLIGFDNCTGATCDTLLGCTNYVPSGCDVPQVPADYVSWWRFEGDVIDFGPGGNDGTIGGDPQYVTGKQGQGLEFDGNDKVEITDNSGLASLPTTFDFSVSLWAKTTSFGADRTAIAFHGTDDINLYAFWSTDTAAVFWRDLGREHYYTHPTSWGADTWHHFAFVSSAANIHNLYVDGELAMTFTDTGDAGPFTGVQLGTREDYEYFTGTLDEVIIYDRALTAQEVQTIFCSQDGSC